MAFVRRNLRKCSIQGLRLKSLAIELQIKSGAQARRGSPCGLQVRFQVAMYTCIAIVRKFTSEVFVWQGPPSCRSRVSFILMLHWAIQRCAFSSSHRLCRAKRFFYASSRLKADPWLLPNTPEHLKSTTTPPDLPPLAPLIRPDESVDTMRARLLYQSRKRGTLESDLLLSTFARDHLSEMSDAEMREYDKVRRVCAGLWRFIIFLTMSTVIG